MALDFLNNLLSPSTSFSSSSSMQSSTTNNSAYDYTYSPNVIINSPNATNSPVLKKDTSASTSTAQQATPSSSATSGGPAFSQSSVLTWVLVGLGGVILYKMVSKK